MRLLITGASKGIGAALVDVVAARNPEARLVMVARGSPDLEALADRMPSQTALACDLTDEAGCERAVSASLEALGGLDGVVSNAGVVLPGALSDLSVADFDRAMNLNLRATFRLARAAHPHLKATRGSLIATGSLAGQHPAPGLGAYSVSKAALSMLIKQLAVEWGPDGIRCNMVSPGTTLTPMNAPIYADEANLHAREQNIPLRRLGTAADIAEVIYFLLRPESGFVTGADIPVDGGATQNLMDIYLRNRL